MTNVRLLSLKVKVVTVRVVNSEINGRLLSLEVKAVTVRVVSSDGRLLLMAKW